MDLDPSDIETALRPEDTADRLLLEERAVPAAAAAGLAARVASARRGRTPGTPVAGMTPNEEQECILTTATGAPDLRALVVAAGAGTGKTATLKMLEEVLPGRGQYTAFNASLVAEAKAKFKKCAVNTTHSLAFRAVGKRYQHRLGGARMRSSEVARVLGVEPMQVVLEGQVDDKGNPRVKTLSAEFLAGQVMTAVKRFCQSADRELGAQHFRYIDGIDAATAGPDGVSRRGRANNDRVREHLLSHARQAWADMARVDGALPFSHDVYVKLWQLGEGDDRPIIAADYILLDEAQDTAPVFLDVVKRQTHALLVMVGDDNQQIYEWRGAVNAMGAFPGAPRRLLSQSYRFGQAIADVANAVLATLDEKTDLVMRGNPAVASRVIEDEEESAEAPAPRCYLFRTNAGAVGRVMSAVEAGKRPHLIGGGAETVAWCRAALELQTKRCTSHPELACFDSWGEVREYSKSDEGSDMRLMVKLVDQFGAAEIVAALEDMPDEGDADLVVSTAHKSKGREWDSVRLGLDFPTVNRMEDSDRRLLYVAATRAKLSLDVSDCPPFCGGEDRGWGESGQETRWVPGLKVKYTVTTPAAHSVSSVATALADLGDREEAARQAPAKGAQVTYTWASVGGKWCVRGPAGTEVGAEVEVTRKDGTVKAVVIKSVMHRYDDAWIYAV